MKTNLDCLVTNHTDTESSAFVIYVYDGEDDATGFPVAGGVAANDNPGLCYG